MARTSILSAAHIYQPQPGVPRAGRRADVPGGGKSAAEMIRQSNLWRDNYNPLRGLTLERLVGIFEAAERGAYAELQLLLRKVEKRYPVLKALKSRRLAALEKLDWDVKIFDRLPSGATAVMAARQQEFLKARYELIRNLREAIGQLALAEFRGYAVLQKHRYREGVNDGAVAELYWLEPWCWAKDGYYGDFFYNEDSRLGIGLGSCATILGEGNRLGGQSLPRAAFVIREVESPLYEIALVAFVNWLMARKDWAAFVEIFGLPNGVVVMPPNIAPGKEPEYQAAAQSVADGLSGALPNGADIKFPTASVRGEAPFEKFCDAVDKDVVLAGTGGLLTMLSMPQGIGHGSSQQHQDAFEEIAHADALKVSETLQADFDRVELASAFPGQPVCVYFELAAKDEEDIKEVVDAVVSLDAIGLQTDEKEVSTRTGFQLKRITPPEQDQAAVDKKVIGTDIGQALRNRALRPAPPAHLADDIHAFAAAVAGDIEPVLARLQAITEIKDDVLFEAKLREFYDQFPRLKSDLLKDPKSDRALLPIITKALVAGMQAGKVRNRGGKIMNGDGKFHGNQYVVVADEHWTGTKKEMSARARAIMSKFAPARQATLGAVRFSQNGIKKSLGLQQTPHEFQAATVMPELIKRGTLTKTEPDREGRPDVKAFHTVESRLQIGGDKYHVGITVKESTDGTKTEHRFYLHRLTPEK